MITYRILDAEDAELFRELRMEALRLHPEAFGETESELAGCSTEKLHERMAPRRAYPQQFVYGAFDADQLIGTVAFYREKAEKERHVGGIWSVYVKFPYRGQGVAPKLMELMIAQARQFEGLEQITLGVATSAKGARRMYEAFGFKLVGVHRRCFKLPDRYVDIEHRVLDLN